MEAPKRQRTDLDEPAGEYSVVLLLEHRLRSDSQIYIIPASELTAQHHRLFACWTHLSQIKPNFRNDEDNEKIPADLKAIDTEVSRYLFDSPGNEADVGKWDKYVINHFERTIQIEGKTRVFRFSVYRY